MKNLYLMFLVSLIALLSVSPTVAQDELEDDPFSDYSHLWENTKKKKKKNKKSNEQLSLPRTLPVDSLP